MMYNESYYKKIEVQMEKVCVLIISEKNPKKLNQLMNEHHRLYDIWKENLYNETPQQQKRRFEDLSIKYWQHYESNIKSITKNKFLKEFGITRHTFTKWVKDRNLPITKVGYRTTFRKINWKNGWTLTTMNLKKKVNKRLNEVYFLTIGDWKVWVRFPI